MAVSIAIEGPEGGGKSLLFSLTRILLQTTLPNPIMAFPEPGGTSLGDRVREILKDNKFKDMHPITNTLLYNAARAELFFKNETPFIEANPTGILLKERCWLSTNVYQKVDGASDEYIENVIHPFIGVPDKFAIIDIPVEETQVRIAAALKHSRDREVDWRDLLPPEILARARNGYLDFASKNRERCLMLDCFDDPWIKAGKIKYEVLRILSEREGRLIDSKEGEDMISTFSNQARQIVETHETYVYHLKKDLKTFDIDELRREVEETRLELGFPDREELQSKMHEEWRALGIEGFSSGIERGK